MEEDYDMEEQHKEMNLEPELRPDLWQTLPEDLTEKIILKVLADLPFSRIFEFCCVFQGRTHFLLSTHYILYVRMDSWMLFNPRRGLWESIPLQFCAAEGLRLQHMQQVSCGEGLLHLSSATNDEFVVCNPLTRRCKRLRRPAGRPLYDPEFGVRMMPDTTWRIASHKIECRPPSVISPHLLAVKVVVYSDAENFHLTVGNVYKDSKGVMHINDSRCSRWEIIGDAPQNYCFLIEPTLFSKESIILGFFACPGGFTVLTYDIGLKRCVWILNIQTIRSIPNATSSSGEILIATLNGDRELEFFEMRDIGPTMTLVTSRFPPLRKGPRRKETSGVQQNIAAASHQADQGPAVVSRMVFNFLRLVHGDIEHYICVLERSGQVEISVWTHNRVNNSDHISDWEWIPSGLESGKLPSARQFYIFKPSLLSPG